MVPHVYRKKQLTMAGVYRDDELSHMYTEEGKTSSSQLAPVQLPAMRCRAFTGRENTRLSPPEYREGDKSQSARQITCIGQSLPGFRCNQGCIQEEGRMDPKHIQTILPPNTHTLSQPSDSPTTSTHHTKDSARCIRILWQGKAGRCRYSVATPSKPVVWKRR